MTVPPGPHRPSVYTDPASGQSYSVDPRTGQTYWLDQPGPGPQGSPAAPAAGQPLPPRGPARKRRWLRSTLIGVAASFAALMALGGVLNALGVKPDAKTVAAATPQPTTLSFHTPTPSTTAHASPTAKPKVTATPKATAHAPTTVAGSAGGCALTTKEDLIYWSKTPTLPPAAQVIGDVNLALCVPTVDTIVQMTPAGPGYCTVIARLADNPRYNADAVPAKRPQHALATYGSAC